MSVTFKTPSGDEMVILPRAEYDRLVEAAEMLRDVATFDRYHEKLARGAEERIPSAIVERLLAGENPMRVWRDHRGLSVRELAERAGLSASYVSEIETGKKDGSVSAMKKIAETLSVDLDELL